MVQLGMCLMQGLKQMHEGQQKMFDVMMHGRSARLEGIHNAAGDVERPPPLRRCVTYSSHMEEESKADTSQIPATPVPLSKPPPRALTDGDPGPMTRDDGPAATAATSLNREEKKRRLEMIHKVYQTVFNKVTRQVTKQLRVHCASIAPPSASNPRRPSET